MGAADTADGARRLERLRAALRDGDHEAIVQLAGDRVAIAGGPRVGKSTLADKLASGRLVHRTDDLVHLGWSEASAAAANWFDILEGPRIFEGVAIGRALRKWLAAHPEGRPVDTVLWLQVPFEERTKGQETMAKGCSTVWVEILPELLRRGVIVVGWPLPAVAAP